MTLQNPLDAAYSKFRNIGLTTFFFSFAINCLQFVAPLYMMQIYDRVLSTRNETTLIILSIITVFLMVIFGVLEWIRSRVLVRAGVQFDDVISQQIFSRAVKLRLINPNGGAEHVLSDGDKIREFLSGPGMLAFFDVPWVPVFIFICFMFHPWLGYLALSGSVVIFSLALLNEFATRRQLKDAIGASQQANQFAAAVLQNAEVIRSMGMERSLGQRWQQRHEQMLDAQAEASDRAGGILTFQKTFRMILQSAILGIGAFLAIEQQISPGIMIATSIMMGRALQPVEQAVGQWKQFISARQAHGRLWKLFASIPGDEERTELPTPQGAIAVEGLTSVAPGTKTPFLRNINFVLKPGETLALLGPSGSGKSSLVRHIAGVWPATNGTVRIDGADISHWNAEQLGQHLGYLPQEVRLFAGSIAENISRFAAGEPAAVIKAATMAGVHDMILRLPNGYETQVGDNGQQLSGGQRQRIGLARALYGGPCLVILDEPNANLDGDGEAALFQAVRTLKTAGTTVILVTHKSNLLTVSDRALVLKDGAVQAFTTPQELLRPQTPTLKAVSDSNETATQRA